MAQNPELKVQDRTWYTVSLPFGPAPAWYGEGKGGQTRAKYTAAYEGSEYSLWVPGSVADTLGVQDLHKKAFIQLMKDGGRWHLRAHMDGAWQDLDVKDAAAAPIAPPPAASPPAAPPPPANEPAPPAPEASPGRSWESWADHHGRLMQACYDLVSQLKVKTSPFDHDTTAHCLFIQAVRDGVAPPGEAKTEHTSEQIEFMREARKRKKALYDAHGERGQRAYYDILRAEQPSLQHASDWKPGVNRSYHDILTAMDTISRQLHSLNQGESGAPAPPPRDDVPPPEDPPPETDDQGDGLPF